MVYEFDGKKYAQASTHQKEWGSRLIEELDLSGTEAVLDLGCGDGGLTRRIAERVPQGRVLGVDASDGMIETALSGAQSNLQFRKLDINDLPFDAEFDVAFSNAALHWVLDHPRLLRNVRRALRAGGRLRFQFGGDGNCANFFAVVRETMKRENFSPFFEKFAWPWYMPTVDEYRRAVEAAGFHDVQVWGENADRYFPDAAAITRWIDQPSIVPFLAHLPGPTKDAFRDFVVDRMIERTRQDDGTCFETFRRINVAATK